MSWRTLLWPTLKGVSRDLLSLTQNLKYITIPFNDRLSDPMCRTIAKNSQKLLDFWLTKSLGLKNQC